ncbi:hypothetical protein GCM10009092_02120 [Bowmanella denitrificans]|uniref:DUF262 domain-containing protein n=2 Tax=Bowmanella denitrificans TaxID=366582 RepID=A0ABN0WLE6_9ALTE
MSGIKLIDNTNLITVLLPDWCGALGEDIYLPLIQRNFVWKPEQIAYLWDSILRGFPLGNLMVVPIEQETKVKCNSEYQSVSSGWLLLDGQQRSRAIAGGYKFSEDNGFRVWVGLNSEPANPKLKFDIRVTTRQHPFGFDPLFRPLSMSHRSAAYSYFEEQYKGEKSASLGLNVTTPFSAQGHEYLPLDVYFDSERTHEELIPFTLKEALEGVKAYQLVALSVSTDVLNAPVEVGTRQDSKPEDSNLPVELLFERIGSGGTRLSNEDYAYSLIKQRMPDAHKVVENVLKQSDLQEFFSPLSLISIALRLSCSFCGEGGKDIDDVHYSKSNIFKIIENNANSRFIQEQVVQAGRLTTLLESLIESLMHTNSNANGLPVYLLKALPISFWQLMICWIWQQPNKHLLESKEQLIGFALLWLFYSPNTKMARKITRHIIKDIRTNPVRSADWLGEQFCLYCLDLSVNNITPKAGLITPEIFRSSVITLANQEEPILKNRNFRIQNLKNQFNDERSQIAAGECLSHFWSNRKLLIWFQRKYLREINKQRAVKISEHITPYDYDHIVPQNYWARGNTSRGKQLQQTNFYSWKLQHNAHTDLGNSIGNYQLLSFADNRVKQDKDYQRFIADFAGDKARDLCIEPNVGALFGETPGKHNNYEWNSDSVKAYQSAIEHRIVDLYTQFYQFIADVGLTSTLIDT